jgi:hypothetical protein
MAKGRNGVLVERVNLWIIVGAFVVAALGILCLYFASEGIWKDLFRELGSLLFVSATITVVWELLGKRAFLDEILAKVEISQEIKFSGICQITDTFHDEAIDWKHYFKKCIKLDICFAYGHSWRGHYAEELRNFASREGNRVRVVLPDPDHEETVMELARRFNYTPQRLVGAIREAESYFGSLRPPEGAKGATIDIWFLPLALVFSFYRFDDIAIIAFYTHRREQVSVPTFVCETGGTLYDFVRAEFNAMIGEGGRSALARKAGNKEAA